MLFRSKGGVHVLEQHERLRRRRRERVREPVVGEAGRVSRPADIVETIARVRRTCMILPEEAWCWFNDTGGVARDHREPRLRQQTFGRSPGSRTSSNSPPSALLGEARHQRDPGRVAVRFRNGDAVSQIGNEER